MFDGGKVSPAYVYEPDTSVVDVDDWNPAEDLAVQTRHDDGLWHRRAIGGLTTACGLPLYRLGNELRHESYRGRLCRDGCFSAHELELSERTNHDR